MLVYFATLTLAIYVQSSGATLSCLSCTDVRNATECANNITCGKYENCFTSTSGKLGDRKFTLGCQSEQLCREKTIPANLIGRRKRAADDSNCHQCCAVDECNSFLCSNIDQITGTSNDTCEDSPNIDCSELSSVFAVCADVDHAKKICKKWCGLCGVVDGSWSDWSAWSSCSVSCGDGHMTRNRTCTDPPPSHGGHDCVGTNGDAIACHHKDACQVNGGWGDWLSWGACSASCGSGIRRRKRNCDTPVPARNGHHCYGDVNDYDICNATSCGVNGGWGDWQAWQACSVTQGAGLRRRLRNCDNPSPADGGHHCYGDVNDYEICQMNQPNITFFTRDVQAHDVAAGSKILYKTMLVDTADSYDNATGVFTAPVHGLYVFTVTASVLYQHGIGLRIETTSEQGQLGELFSVPSEGHTTSSVTGVGELQAGSQVWVQCLYSLGSGDDFTDNWTIGQQNSFQGALIRMT